MAANYNSVGSTPYGSGDAYYNNPNSMSGYITPAKKKGTSKWLTIGIPIAVLIVAGAVVGGVLGSRKKSSSTSAAAAAAGTDASGSVSTEAAVSAKAAIGIFATATDSQFMIPVYPSTTNAAAFTSPTFVATGQNSWPDDPWKPVSPAVTSVRTDRPRLIAPQYMWDALPNLVAQDAYLKKWNDTIFGNATAYYSLPPVVYALDGPSGILDNAREVKMRVKAFSYAYRVTKDTKWATRAFTELEHAASDDFGPTNNTKWNPSHFLDTAEFSAAYGIGYDWLYDVLTDDQKTSIRGWLIQYGLSQGVLQFTGGSGWWTGKDITGNWNCVCNSGLTMGSLAILGDDTTGTATQLLGLTVPNAKTACAFGPSSDGSWQETPNYWYFGTTGHTEMTASLISATGSDYGLLDVNPGFALTGQYHMYVTGSTSMFNYGDHGPNKFSTTANGMFFWAQKFNKPEYALFQRDRVDSPEPWSMFWYEPTATGAFWDGLALDAAFENQVDQWMSMRSSWTDSNALYVAMKAGKDQSLQTHNDLDVGDFVLDALGTRWAGDLGSADYRAPDYFTSQDQDAVRWQYYRKMTEGQNTILISQKNQNVLAQPTIKHDSSGTTQGSSTVFDVPDDSTAYFTTDMTSAYFDATSVKRGVRVLNKRRQVLIQDEITSTGAIQWRMHTNATVAIDTSGTSATLTLDGQTMKIAILSPSSGATMSTSDAVRFPTDVTPPAPDQENPGVTVLIISLDAGTVNLQVLFNPQWSGMSASDFVTPPNVALDDWSLTSHN